MQSHILSIFAGIKHGMNHAKLHKLCILFDVSLWCLALAMPTSINKLFTETAAISVCSVSSLFYYFISAIDGPWSLRIKTIIGASSPATTATPHLEKQHKSTPTASERHSRGAITAEIHTLRPRYIIMLQHNTHIMFYIKNVTCMCIMHYKCTSINLIKCPPSSGVSLRVHRVRGLTIIASLSVT